jgi:hypothetical protein
VCRCRVSHDACAWADAKKLREHVEELEERLTAAQADDQVKVRHWNPPAHLSLCVQG